MAGFAARHPRAFNSRKEATQTHGFSFVLEGGLDVSAALIPTGDGGHGTARRGGVPSVRSGAPAWSAEVLEGPTDAT